MLVPSDTLSGLLWVVVARAALFRGLLHINATKKLAVGHSIRWQQLFLRYFLASILPIHSRCTSFSMEFPRRSLLNDRIYVWSMLCLSEETLLLEPPFLIFPLACYLWDSELNTLTIVYSSSNQSKSSAKTQDPIYNFRLLSLQYIFLIYKLINVSFNLFFNFMILINFYIYIYIYIFLNDSTRKFLVNA